MAHSALADRSPGFLLGTITLAVVVSLIAGIAIGYQVDNSKGTGKPAKEDDEDTQAHWIPCFGQRSSRGQAVQTGRARQWSLARPTICAW